MSERKQWIDAARGVALTAVVFMHAVEVVIEDHTVNGALVTLDDVLDGFRMPTLVAISGMLAAGVRGWSFADVLRRRVGPLFLMYFSWLLVTTTVRFLRGDSWQAQENRWLMSFVRPEVILWYLYALALYILVAWLARKVPTAVIVPAAFVIYLASRSWVTWDGTFLSWHFVLDHWIYFVCAERFASAYIRTAERSRSSYAVLAILAFAGVGAVAIATDTAGDPWVLAVLAVAGTLLSLLCAGAWGAARWLSWARAIGFRSLGVYASHAIMLSTLWQYIAPRVPSYPGGGVLTPIAIAGVTLASAYGVTLALGRWAPVPLLRPWWSIKAKAPAPEPAVTAAE